MSICRRPTPLAFGRGVRRRAAVSTAGKLDKPPKLLRFVEAEPPAALAERQQVDVVLTIDVDETGKVVGRRRHAGAATASTRRRVAAARQFVFAPGESAGKPVPVRITYHYASSTRAAAAATAAAARPGRSAPAPPTVPFVGRVLRAGDRQPLAGRDRHRRRRRQRRHATDADGRFHFDALPVGAHTLHVAAPRSPSRRHSSSRSPPASRSPVTWYVLAASATCRRCAASAPSSETVEQTLSGDEMRRIPGTQGDTLKAVQNLPGVARAPFGGGLLVVWGSAPDDTRIYVDGVYIPTLYHFGGLRSTVNSEMVQRR